MDKYWIIKTGCTFEELKQSAGDFEDWIVEAMDIDANEAEVWNLETREELPEGNDTRGIIITGSLSNVYCVKQLAEDLRSQGLEPEQMYHAVEENGYGKILLKRFKAMCSEM